MRDTQREKKMRPIINVEYYIVPIVNKPGDISDLKFSTLSMYGKQDIFI